MMHLKAGETDLFWVLAQTCGYGIRGCSSVCGRRPFAISLSSAMDCGRPWYSNHVIRRLSYAQVFFHDDTILYAGIDLGILHLEVQYVEHFLRKRREQYSLDEVNGDNEGWHASSEYLMMGHYTTLHLLMHAGESSLPRGYQ